jgi:hypothetical protein
LHPSGPTVDEGDQLAKRFHVKGLTPDGVAGARSKLLALLTQHQIPAGTESQYRNTIEFFDASEKIRVALASGKKT